MLLFNKRASSFAVNELSLSHPAAIASSGFKSSGQNLSSPPLIRMNNDPSHEISGGDVSAITTSWRGMAIKRAAQANRNDAKLSVRCQRCFLPALTDEMRTMSTECHLSRRGKLVVASS